MNQEQRIEELNRKEAYTFEDLKTIVDILRGENGCPWDREQTHKSIRNCMIEEAYEVVEAIDTENSTLLREELGDVLFQIMFHSHIEFEKNEFSVEDVVNDICEKMIRRHPHVFSGKSVNGSESVLQNWERIKTEEKQRKTLAARLRAVPPMLPALMRASKVAQKAKLFEEQPNGAEVICKLSKQLAESQTAESLGALLMAISVYASSREMDAEQALGQAIEREILRIKSKEAE